SPRWMVHLGDLLPRQVLTIEEEQLAAIGFSFSDPPVTTLSLSRLDDGEWAANWSIDGELDQDAVSLVVASLTTIEAERFADAEVTAEIAGLDNPIRVADIQLRDGTSHRIEIGLPVEVPDADESNPERAMRYARVDGGSIFEWSGVGARALFKETEDLVTDSEG
ncbi:MAG: hypothetical protein KC561_09305, partial [Myxococcales bacterium]|nr:hypothetical protein [Myxococcales bacterium]